MQEDREDNACFPHLVDGMSLCPIPHSVFLRRHSLHPIEELAKTALVGKMQSFSYGGERKLRSVEQPQCFHQKHLVYVVYHGAPRYLSHYT